MIRIARISMGLTAALAVLLVAAPAHAAGAKGNNAATVSARYADYGIVRIALAGVTSVDGNADSEKMFRQTTEMAFGELKYKFQGWTYFINSVRQAKAESLLDVTRKAAFAGAAPDPAALAAVRSASAVDALLFGNLTRVNRNVIDADTRGQSSTDVGGEFVLLALKDGAVVWRGNFAERGLGAYNDPNVADVPQRDPTGNAVAHSDALDPPDVREVMEKLLKKVAASLPAPVAAATPSAH
jgi:hypothetical protein